MTSSPKSGHVKGALAPLLLAIALGLFGGRPVWDVDIFWHIAAGNWIINNLAFPHIDIFSYTEPAATWVTFQWGYEVLVALVDRTAGLAGVRVFHALATSAAFAAFAYFSYSLAVLARSKGTSRLVPALAATLAVAVLFVLYADRVRARPHIFNLLFWSLLAITLFGKQFSYRARLFVGASLMFVWSNIHAGGSFVFLIAALSIPVASTLLLVTRKSPLAARWSTSYPSSARSWGLWGALALACCLAPNWLGGVWQAYAMLGGSEGLIEEWLPFWHYFEISVHPVHYACALAPLVGLALLGAACARTLRSDNGDGTAAYRLRLETVFLCLGLAFLPFRSARFVFYVAFVFVFVHPPLAALFRKLAPKWRRLGASVASAAVLALFAGGVHFHTYAQFGSIERFSRALSADIDERRFPTEMVAPLEVIHERTGRDGPLRLFCLPNWGGYLLYKLYPRVRVLADGRGNFTPRTGKSLEFIYYYRHEGRYSAAVEQIYNDSGANVLVVQRPAFFPGYQPRNWHRVFASMKGEIWVRKSSD